jgi:hypothetical protein
MISTEAFWTRVGVYNETTWPLQLVLVVAAAVLTYMVFARPGRKTDRWMKAFLSFAFAWNGVVLFLFYLKNPVSMFTGTPLFIIVAVLFAVDIFTQKTQFRLPDARWRQGLTMLWILLAFLYPLIGWPLGHTFPQVLTPLFPCPLTVFALALVAAAAPNVDKKVFVFLLPWALMGLPKCFGGLDCYEDCILFAAGVYGLIELIRNWKAGPSVERGRPAFTARRGSAARHGQAGEAKPEDLI